MAGGGQQQQGGGDNSLGFLWILIGVFILVLLVWFVWHAQIVAGIFKIKLAEIAVIGIFTSALDPVKTLIQSVSTDSVSITDVGAVSHEVGRYLRFPFAIILAFFAFILYKASAKDNYRKTYSMKSLQKQEQANWPQISPTVNLNLAEENIDTGKWAMALTPVQFAKKHELIREEKKQSEEGVLTKSKRIVPVVIASKANSIFVQQLGRPWSNVKALKKHTRALFAIFAARANGDRDAAQNMLWQLASSSSGRLNYHGVDDLLKKHADSKVVKIVTGQHAYENTVMAAMLELARTDGVLASAEFIWLKPLDRHLWFILNTVGRQTAPPEIAGVYAHWISEKAVGRRMVIPMIHEATKALQVALDEMIYTPDEKDGVK